LAVAPGVRDLRQLMAQLRVDLARPQHAGLVGGLLEPVDGLTHLPDRAPLERERRRVDDRLVAVVEHVESVLAVDLEATLRGAEDCDPPIPLVRVLDEARHEWAVRLRWTDRVAGD